MTESNSTTHPAGPRDPAEFDPANEEPADMGELDYDYSSVQEKIEAGLGEKRKGNDLFSRGEYEKAWKQYDRCFIHVYTSKEEWAAIGPTARQAINDFKMPCHLNRGLCRLRLDDLPNALWDFSEALRISPENPKGLYRRALVLTRIVRADMAKEGSTELWDLDDAEKKAEDARKDLVTAVKLAPNDPAIRAALDDLRVARDELRTHRVKYRADQRRLYSTFISNLDRENQKMEEAEQHGIFDDMPELERIRIS